MTPHRLLASLLGLAPVTCGPDKTSDDPTGSSTADVTAATQPTDASASTGGPVTTPTTGATDTTDTPATTDTTATTASTNATDTTEDNPADQTPPQGHDAIEAWLAAGHYKSWACQPAPHGPIPISPHGMQRVCSNAVLSTHPPDGGEYPVGSAGVKELYDADATEIVGYAVYLHTKPGTDGGSWYWYERVPLESPAPHDDNGVVADGPGDSGTAMSICVGCHSATGLDADHPGHDFVYTQVQ